MKKEQKVIKETSNYNMFSTIELNRDVAEKKHKNLYDSMKEHGFYWFLPLVCHRDKKTGKLLVDDGQHRLAIARILRIPVYYVITTQEISIPQLNSTSIVWTLKDYVSLYIKAGIKDYEIAVKFVAEYLVGLGKGLALLAGKGEFSSVKKDVESGKWRIKDYDGARRTSAIYRELVLLSKDIKSSRLISAIQACCMVEFFNESTLINKARKQREKLVSYSTSDAYLSMIEDIYNKGSRVPVALKIEALKATRARQNEGAVKASKGRKK